MKNFNISAISINSLKSLQLPFNINLQRRERVAIAVAGAVLLIFLILQLIIFPIIDRRERLRKAIVTRTEDLMEIEAKKTEYRKLSLSTQGLEAGIKNRPQTFTLFSFIDQLSGRSGIKSNIVSMKPSTSNLKNSAYKLSTVEMKLNALTLEQLTTFLYGAEDPQKGVWIKRITVSKGDTAASLLSAIIVVETFQR